MSLQDEHDIATKRPDVKEAYIKLTDAITGARTSMTAQGKPDRCPTCNSVAQNIAYCCLRIDGKDYCGICPDAWHSSPVPAARKGSAEMDDGTHIEFAKNIVKAKPAPAAAPHIEYDSAGYPHKVKPSAPQAESVPSGKDEALAGYLDQIGLKHTRKCVPFVINYLCMRCRVEVAAKAFLASQTAALEAAYDEAHPQRVKWAMICRTFDITDYKAACVADISDKVAALLAELAGSREGHRITGDCLKESLERVAELERSNSLLRERLTAAEGLLRNTLNSARGYLFVMQSPLGDEIDAYFKENQ